MPGVRVLLVIGAMIAAPIAFAAGRDVPLPRPRPADIPSVEDHEPQPSACQARLADIAVARARPAIEGPGGCGGTDLVELEEIALPNDRRVAMTPSATLRCGLAEAIAHWVRDEVAPASAALGSPLQAIENYDSYDCRGRNRVVGAKLSEHGRANAVDIKAVRLADGRSVSLAAFAVDVAFRTNVRRSACERFTTVLGPGSDGYHEMHIHVDLAERRGGYRMCQWDLEPPPKAEAEIPLPRPRPTVYNDPAPSACSGEVDTGSPLRTCATRPRSGTPRHDRAQ